MNVRGYVYSFFVAGMFFINGLNSLFQDLLGKEAYIQFIKKYWISSWLTVPIALFMIIGSIFYMSYQTKKLLNAEKIANEANKDIKAFKEKFEKIINDKDMLN